MRHLEMERKVYSGGLAGALTVIVVWLLGEMGVGVPPEVASSFTVVISVATGWAVESQ